MFICLWINCCHPPVKCCHPPARGWRKFTGGWRKFSARFARYLPPPWPKRWNRLWVPNYWLGSYGVNIVPLASHKMSLNVQYVLLYSLPLLKRERTVYFETFCDSLVILYCIDRVKKVSLTWNCGEETVSICLGLITCLSTSGLLAPLDRAVELVPASLDR